MSLRTVVEVALHFEGFRNVDLFHQGLYHLRSRIHREDGDARFTAVPYACSTCPAVIEKSKPSRTDHHNLIPGHINEESGTFSTRSFLVRYCEEEVELNDCCQFRIEVDESELNKPIVLEVDLMFADLSQQGGVSEDPDVESTEFKSVSTQKFCIHGSVHGLHEFVPIVFGEFHFCLTNLVVHTVLLDYRFRLQPLPRATSRGTEVATAGQETKAPSNSTQEAVVFSSQNGSFSLLECIGGARGKDFDSCLQATESFYQKYFGLLSGSYSKLSVFFEEVCAKCLTPAQREAFGEDIAALDRAPFDVIPVLGKLPNGESVSSDGMKSQWSSLREYLVAQLPSKATEQAFTSLIYRDFNSAYCKILQLWHRLLNTISFSCHEIGFLLRTSWEHSIRLSWNTCILKKADREDLIASDEKGLDEIHKGIASQLRSASKAKLAEQPTTGIEDLSFKADMGEHPILIEQRYKGLGSNGSPLVQDNSIPSAPKTYRGVHLFVLVHGWQGNSFDMRLMKNNLALLFPEAIFLCSTANEDLTDGDLNESGIRLAQEVMNYIQDWCPGSALGRLSFITFSLGGLIVRSALPLLHEYSNKMYTFMSICSAHLGYIQKAAGVLTYGLKVLAHWRDAPVLNQLTMQDGKVPQESLIYRLSKTKGFELFQWVVLVGSAQDQFAPHPTARACTSAEWEKQADKQLYFSMVKNIWEAVNPERVFRFDVNFAIPENTVDSAIGRAAHIRFLENQPVMKMIIHNYSFLFR
mmetsp:Transcript_110309/g.172498  ORF Transcript_110309/g.172498 Transcript_110309/m.172498 type:complete len:752 (-) Transcript_110309:227-2482(-)